MLGAVGVLLAGFLVGLAAPWRLGTGNDTGSPGSRTRAVEPIVPATPPELADPGRVPSTTTPQPFPGLPDDLQRFFGDRLPLPPDFFDRGRFGFTLDGIVHVTRPPDGYRVTGNSLQIAPGSVAQQLVLTGPDGDIVVEARRGDIGELGDGEPVTVRGVEARLAADGTLLRLTWNESDTTQVTIDAPSGLGVDALLALAEDLEVTP